MLNGPGKYDHLCTAAREGAHAAGAVLMIFDGHLGNGFAVQATPDKLLALPELLELMARKIRADLEQHTA